MKNQKIVKIFPLMVAASTAFSLSACAANKVQYLDSTKTGGRIIEFTSGAEGFDTHTYFYEGANEVIAFDAQFTPDLARKALRHLRTVTNKPVTWLVITHPNPDKFNGASVFRAEGARVIASRATANAIDDVHRYKKYFFINIAGMFTENSYPQAPAIDEVFSDKLTLNLQGGEKIELREFNRPGVSGNQTVAWIPSDRSLIVGDLVHYHAHAWLEGGIKAGKPAPNLASWVEILRDLTREYPSNALVYGGRGTAVALSIAIPQQIQYLSRAGKIVSRYIDHLGTRQNELTSDKASEHHKALSQEFAVQFPDYQYTYMIEYGVYGLVQSLIPPQK